MTTATGRSTPTLAELRARAQKARHREIGNWLARRVARMPAASVAAVKRVVDVSLGNIEPALVAETNAFGELTAAGTHVEPMRRFLAAGGQTREAETASTDALIDAMINPG